MENLVSLCSQCHSWAHEHPTAAEKDGWIVETHVRDISDAPLRAFYGKVLLTTDGDVTWLT